MKSTVIWLQCQQLFILTKYVKKIVEKYNNTYHRTIKMTPVEVKSKPYINLVDLVLWTYLIENFKEEIVGTFYKNDLQKKSKTI